MADQIVTPKYCGTCQQTKSPTDFHHNKSAGDGLNHRCKPCQKLSDAKRSRKKYPKRIPRTAREPKHGAYGYKVRGCRCDLCHHALREMNERWATRNPDKVATNRVKQKAANARSYAKNRERVRVRRVEFHRKYPDRAALYARRRRFRKLRAGGTTSPKQLEARIAFYGGRCYLCKAPYEHIDHVIPVAGGGSNWPANLRPICRSCNVRKWKFPLKEYLAIRERAC